jgi:hypothetical protein
MNNPTIGYEQQFTQFGTGNTILLTNPTSNISQFTLYHVDLSTGFSYKTFNYNYPGEVTNFLTKNPTTSQLSQFTGVSLYNNTSLLTFNYTYPNEVTDFLTKNPTTNASQFTLYPTDQSTGKSYETFDYTYPNEVTNLTNKNPTTTTSDDGVLLTKEYGSLPDPNNLTEVDKSSGRVYKTFKFNYPNKPTGSLPNTTVLTSTNLQLSSYIAQGTGITGTVIGGGIGIPQLSQLTDSVVSIATGNDATYSTLPFNKLKSYVGVKYSDFRSRKVWDLNDLQKLGKPRLDGTSAAFRQGTPAYPILSASPAGVYSIFNLDGYGKTGYGWGDHDNPYATRFDFTARSAAALQWDNDTKYWRPTTNALEFVTPFRGDRVTVIDFNKRRLENAYVWRKQKTQEAYENSNKEIPANDKTQDFIKFFLTGPLLQPGSNKSDDIIVFRATINSLTDTFSPEWTPVNMIGRADPNYQYGGVSRDLSLDFTVIATDRDELQPIWRKLNALAGYTAPTYDTSTIAYRAPWMRFTIGDLFRQQPAIITSLAYTLHDQETTWETNIERDPTMVQSPHKVSVSLGLTLITNELPQKGGRFYTLTSNEGFTADGQTTAGSSNWLSDFLMNPTTTQLDNRYLPTLPPIGLTAKPEVNTDDVASNSGVAVNLNGNGANDVNVANTNNIAAVTNNESPFSNLIANNQTSGNQPILIKENPFV